MTTLANTKQPLHLNALKAFEATARHLSFSGAAEELFVTPAAVGQLVRSLEDLIGYPLFQRTKNRRESLILTELAIRALPDIQAGFDSLNLGMARLKEGVADGILNITMSPAFAAKWFLHRVEHFQNQWPDIDISLLTSLKLLNFNSQRIDIGIRYGLGDWVGLKAELLMSEDIFPVCSPEFLLKYPNINCTTGMITQTLIHDLSMDNHKDFVTWDDWLRQFNQSEITRRPGLRINNSAAVLQAAIEGQGIALARSIMVNDDLKSGRLVRICPNVSLPSPFSYYLVYRSGCEKLPKIALFREWLLSEIPKY